MCSLTSPGLLHVCSLCLSVSGWACLCAECMLAVITVNDNTHQLCGRLFICGCVFRVREAHLPLYPLIFQFMIMYPHSPWFTPKAKSQTQREVNDSIFL